MPRCPTCRPEPFMKMKAAIAAPEAIRGTQRRAFNLAKGALPPATAARLAIVIVFR